VSGLFGKNVFLSAIFIAGLIFGQEAYASGALDRYVRLSQVEPIFAWPGVDLERMTTAIALLGKSRSEIISLVKKQYNEQQQNRVQKVLYPTQYLSEMVVLEGLRRALPQNASEMGLHEYQQQLERTISAYQAYLNVLIPALLRTAREQDYKGLEYHFGKSSFGYFISGIRSYRAQSDRALEMSRQRWACVQNEGPECKDAHWPELPAPPKGTVDQTMFANAPAKIVSNMRLNSRVPGHMVKPAWAVTYSHRCFVYRPQVYYFLWRFSPGYNAPVWRMDVVNDVLVHDHRVTSNTRSAYKKKLAALGADGYLFQSFTNPYACPDIASDTSLVRSMGAVYRALDGFNWAQANTLNLDLAKQYEELQNKAAAITEKPYASEYLVQGFMHDLSILMNTNSRQTLIAFWGAAQQSELEEMLLEYEDKTSDLSGDIMNLVYSNIAIGDYVPYAPWGYLEELMFTRNDPELLLGGSNPSIIYDNVPQVERHRKETSPRLKSYNDELAKKYTPAEFTKIMIKGNNAEAALSALQGRAYLQNLFWAKPKAD